MNPRLRTDWLLLVGFCLFLFFYGLGSFGLVGADEPRYAQVAREMLQRHDWITPTLGGQPWLEKPALFYWQAEAAYAVFGVHDWVARIPSALDASLMIFAVYWFLRLRSSVALEGALMVASTAGVIGLAHSAATDMPLTAMFAVAMLAWFAWWETQRKVLLAAFYFFLALAALAKGPVAPFLAAAIIILFAAVAGRGKILLRTLWLPALLVFFCVTLPWYVLVQLHNPEFFRIFILEHNLARFGTNLYRHQQPFWYFVPVAILSVIPWTIFVCAGVWETSRAWWAERHAVIESGDALSVFLLLWLLVPIVFFSLSQSKLPGYILPAIPAGVLLAVEWFRRHLGQTPSWSAILLHGALTYAWLVPALLIQYLLLQQRIPGGTPLLVASAFAIAIAVGMIAALRRLGWGMLRTVTLVPVVLGVAVLIRVGAPVLDRTLSARPVAEQLDRLEPRPFPVAVFGVKRDTAYGLAFYRNQLIEQYTDGRVPPAEHLLVAPHDQMGALATYLGQRDVQLIGSYDPQNLDFYKVSEQESPSP